MQPAAVGASTFLPPPKTRRCRRRNAAHVQATPPVARLTLEGAPLPADRPSGVISHHNYARASLGGAAAVTAAKASGSGLTVSCTVMKRGLVPGVPVRKFCQGYNLVRNVGKGRGLHQQEFLHS